jgi:hypothetical protein
MRHGLRLNRWRLGLLTQLWRAGEAGIALVMFDEPQTFISCGLAEEFTDPTRTLPDRLRLTRDGKRYADALCPNKRSTS